MCYVNPKHITDLSRKFSVEQKGDVADMNPFQLYNVKRGAWHSHTFNEDAKVLIVENHDTVDVNSPFVYLMPGQCQQVINVSSG